VNTLLDHQTVGGGPYTKTLPTGARLTGYRNAVYYCAQNGFSSTCARSDNGGLTFGAGVPTYNTPANGGTKGGACSAIHGHLRVGPDGTAYLPNKGCGGTLTAGNLTNSEFFGGGPALSVSEDNGDTTGSCGSPGYRRSRGDSSSQLVSVSAQQWQLQRPVHRCSAHLKDLGDGGDVVVAAGPHCPGCPQLVPGPDCGSATDPSPSLAAARPAMVRSRMSSRSN